MKKAFALAVATATTLLTIGVIAPSSASACCGGYGGWSHSLVYDLD
ncbi:hypothetical protein ACIBH1_46945 [Nonomuraea sp. NPDC050663]